MFKSFIFTIVLFSGFIFPVMCQSNDVITAEDSIVLAYAGAMPRFRGGDEGFSKFLMKNIIQPRDGNKERITGTVYIEFIIEKDGSVSNIKSIPLKDIDADPRLAKVVIDALSKSPKWKPGMNNGIPVRVRKVVPVKFI